jgi:hypothetical protein
MHGHLLHQKVSESNTGAMHIPFGLVDGTKAKQQTDLHARTTMRSPVFSYTLRQSKPLLLVGSEDVPNTRQTPNTSNNAYLVLQPFGAWTCREVSLDLRKTPESGFVGNV